MTNTVRTPYTRQRAVTVPDARKQASVEACRVVTDDDWEPEPECMARCSHYCYCDLPPKHEGYHEVHDGRNGLLCQWPQQTATKCM